MIAEQDATIKRGGSYSLRVDLTDDDGGPLSLTGLSLYYRVAKRAHSDEAVLEINDADITKDGSTAVIPLTTVRTLTIPASTWYHELYAIDGDEERDPLMEGNLTVEAAQVAEHS